MRLAYFTDSFYPELGGIQDSIAAQARALAGRGHRLLIAAPGAADADFRLAGLDRGEPDLGPGVQILRLPAIALPGSTGQSRLVIGAGPIGAAIGAFGPDLVHVHTFLGAGWLGARAARRLDLPLIGTNHWAADGFGLYAPRFLEAPVARGFMGAVSRFYRRCAVVTTPSRATADAMHRAGFRRPITVVSNPIDLTEFRPAAPDAVDALRDRLGLKGRWIVYAGRLAIEKKVDVLIDAFALAARGRPDLGLALAGHGSARAALERRAVERGVAGRIRFLGALPHADLAGWFQASTVFAIASTSESQCMALLQAMACQRPAVVVDSRALPEVLGPDAGEIAPPDDPAAFAAALGRLLDDPARARRCGDAARRRAARASVSAVTDQWETLYAPFAPAGRPDDAGRESRRDSERTRSAGNLQAGARPPGPGASARGPGDHDRHSGAQRGSLPRPLP